MLSSGFPPLDELIDDAVGVTVPETSPVSNASDAQAVSTNTEILLETETITGDTATGRSALPSNLEGDLTTATDNLRLPTGVAQIIGDNLQVGEALVGQVRAE